MKGTPREGEPCDHPGCLNHISHPCEGCGRVGGKKSEKINTTPVLRFEDWYAKEENNLDCEAAESGMDRELDFDKEQWIEKKYEEYLHFGYKGE
ncbi:MAG: hypothetical protein KAS32_05530 [Candidatus Peribacteraceae bacterium]|nr:hypothetical protein [Candidatus Peribacteraceae bacterium]